MLKKIVLGVIIGLFFLTVSTGGIYAYQKNADNGQVAATSNTNKNENGICDPESCREKACLQIQNRNHCTDDEWLDYENNHLNQNRNMENNCYQNNDVDCYQVQNNHCHQETIQNKYNSRNCQMDGKNDSKDIAVKKNYGKNR